MTKIGLISDTHGYYDDNIKDFFSDCDEIWHAGDIGTCEIIQKLSKIAKVRAVYGNIDGTDIRHTYKQHAKFKCEDMNVWITHIGGYPGRYDAKVKPEIFTNTPDIFISGHSHILKVIYDKKINCLHLNPGAYGKSGIHNVRTALKFDINKKEVINMQIFEAKR